MLNKPSQRASVHWTAQHWSKWRIQVAPVKPTVHEEGVDAMVGSMSRELVLAAEGVLQGSVKTTQRWFNHRLDDISGRHMLETQRLLCWVSEAGWTDTTHSLGVGSTNTYGNFASPWSHGSLECLGYIYASLGHFEFAEVQINHTHIEETYPSHPTAKWSNI